MISAHRRRLRIISANLCSTLFATGTIKRIHMFELFHYQFIQKAIVAGCFIAILCSTLGVFLVLRRLSLIGDGLAHVTFGSIAVGLLFSGQPMYTAIPLVMLSSLGILRLTERAHSLWRYGHRHSIFFGNSRRNNAGEHFGWI